MVKILIPLLMLVALTVYTSFSAFFVRGQFMTASVKIEASKLISNAGQIALVNANYQLLHNRHVITDAIEPNGVVPDQANCENSDSQFCVPKGYLSLVPKPPASVSDQLFYGVNRFGEIYLSLDGADAHKICIEVNVQANLSSPVHSVVHLDELELNDVQGALFACYKDPNGRLYFLYKG